MKKHSSSYNIIILLLTILIIASLIGLFFVRKKNNSSELEIVASDIKEDEKITEDEARELAVKQFEKLGETISAEDLMLEKVTRRGIEYYYVESHENSLEIQILGGQIIRINTILVHSK